MKFPPPDEDQVYADLSPFFDLCWRAIEQGASHAVGHFKKMKHEVDDAGLAAHLTRYAAKKFFDANQGDVAFVREELAFSGLLVKVVRNQRVYNIRIRRSADGTLPFPDTDTLRAFYKQPKQKYLPGLEPSVADEASLREVHLMVLWCTPSDYSSVTSLTCACPKGVAEDEVVTYWEFAVPHPSAVEDLVTPDAEETPADDLQIAEHERTAEQGNDNE